MFQLVCSYGRAVLVYVCIAQGVWDGVSMLFQIIQNVYSIPGKILRVKCKLSVAI